MKITKYYHSCLLVEEQDSTILIDPGIYTEPVKDDLLANLSRLDFILITHEHFDHLSPLLLKDLQTKFPDVTIVSNQSVVALLEKENIQASVSPPPHIALLTVPHQKMWMGPPAENTIFTVFNRLTHPGDTLQFEQTAEILALPLTAPWGSTMEAVEKTLELKPKIVIPIHDWMWKDEVRKQFYDRLTEFFKQHDIDFRGIETNETIEI